MDPASIVGLVGASIDLAMKCGSVARNLNEIAAKYKYARLTILSMVQGLETIQLAWSRIGEWSQSRVPAELAQDVEFMQTLERLLEAGTLVMETLEEELMVYNTDDMGFTQRTKVIWNENTRVHRDMHFPGICTLGLGLTNTQMPTSHQNSMATLHNHVE